MTLNTTHVAAGTSVPFSLSGTGITASDVVGGQLSGNLVIDANGVGRTTLVLAADATTEGRESLRVALLNGAAHVDVSIADTSLTPPPTPTYALSVDVASQNEGGDLVYTLRTTLLAAGTTVAYSLSGSGITTADVVGGVLGGVFTVDAAGLATSTVHLSADATLEGAEVLHLQLAGNAGQIDATINDTSVPPPPSPTNDVVLIADTMSNAHAGPPANALEGEIGINTFLSADLLNQSGAAPLRMSLADLRSTNVIAGAPLNTTNHSADRGNIPQVSNQRLFTFDLGGGTDRVDYSAESGRIVDVFSTESPANTQYVLVNDNAVDRVFNQATDRIDTLVNVEEVVASAGGGVIDLTRSARDWTINYSRAFNATTDIDLAHDREQRRVVLTDQATGLSADRVLVEYRDAGLDPAIVQPLATWSIVEGSDRNETLIFTGVEAQDERASHLRGGVNSVKFNELTRSILVDVAIVPWAASTNLADDGNASGMITATTRFTNGDGVTLAGAQTNVTTSHTPDNAVAAGLLRIAGSQDAEDAIGFGATPGPKLFVLGQTIGGSDVLTARLVSGSSANALELTGFELLRDNGTTDDVYVINNIVKATTGSPKLVDAGADHDTIRLATEALGAAAVGGVAATINLATLNAIGTGFNFDFDVLDLSAVSAVALTVIGTAGIDDELVVGALSTLGGVTQFESLVLTDASLDKGAALTLDLDAGAVKAGSTLLFGYTGATLSAGGTVYGSAGQAGAVAALGSSVSMGVIDSSAGAGATLWGGSAADILTGGAGNDTLRGGGGNDTLSGGLSAESWSYTLGGTPDAVAAAANRIAITMTIDGTVLTLTEAAVADTAYGDGNGAVVDGAALLTIGQAMVGLVNANLAAINSGPGTGHLDEASYNMSTGQFLLSFAPGVNASDVVTVSLNSGTGPDGGGFVLVAGPHRDGSNGGADTLVFEATGVLNGSDTILDFTKASDKLVVTAFTGGAISAPAHRSTARSAAPSPDCRRRRSWSSTNPTRSCWCRTSPPARLPASSSCPTAPTSWWPSPPTPRVRWAMPPTPLALLVENGAAPACRIWACRWWARSAARKSWRCSTSMAA
ncbi:MAG: hypothetical protein IPP44_08035 [Ideonella sp.]|nr:hypothetical protein [Ideonella sp.]